MESGRERKRRDIEMEGGREGEREKHRGKREEEI